MQENSSPPDRTSNLRDRGLRRDGVLTPGGETECTLCVEISRLLRRAGR